MSDEEDMPIRNRPRVQAWAARNFASLPRPVLGSSERHVMLEEAQRLENEAEILYKEIKVLRKKAEHLKEQAYHKRVLCAPIRSLPLETLSSILVLATPEAFEFNVIQVVPQPLSAVSRGWCDIVKRTPEFYSRINIDISYSVWDRMDEEQAARRLPSWLAKARNTGLDITFHCWDGLHLDQSLHSCGPTQVMWMMLLSQIENWQKLSFRGASPLIYQFLERAHSAQRLKLMSVHSTDQPRRNSLGVFITKSPPCSIMLPRLQNLLLSGHFPPEFVTNHMPAAVSLQTLTLKGLASPSKEALRGLATAFPFLSKLRLENVFPRSLEPLLSGFKHLQRFELSHGMADESGDTVALPALHGISTLKSLRLQFSAFHINDKCKPLPSVELLELELGRMLLVHLPFSQKLAKLYTLLPSLKFLKASPQPGYRSGTSSDARGLLHPLFVGTDIPICPDLAEVFLEKVMISRCDIAAFIADRTFDATLAALDFLEQNCIGEFSYENDKYRNARHEKWKPTCRVTTINCPKIPDMADAGLQALVDACKSSKLRLADFGRPKPTCELDCECYCGDQECPCCEHQWVDSDYSTDEDEAGL